MIRTLCEHGIIIRYDLIIGIIVLHAVSKDVMKVLKRHESFAQDLEDSFG